MELILIVMIVCLAGAYVGYTFYKQFKGKSACSGCSCDVNVQKTCSEIPKINR